ncbi:ExbD/TolR family protein [Sagittula salina]|uniref:Biopolymer transporter ExbD n=1 Tax=Sagittula salina TaxID=2820268 RepID=A0A940S3D2_9RHOB|nr:biopolymer transporter ExbD [Sagittula salina]MBP0484982.1 biopolymer transporter ExbD [Sagittula salina]
MSQSKLKLPTRPRSYRFAMTPLADAMFQLLIFFMLTSSLTPYSLLTLQTPAEAPQEDQAGLGPSPAPQAPSTPPDTAIWTLDAETIVVGGQDFTFDDLDALADALGTEAAPGNVVILIRDTARVQDVTTVLARLSGANVGSVRVAQGAQ